MATSNKEMGQTRSIKNSKDSSSTRQQYYMVGSEELCNIHRETFHFQALPWLPCILSFIWGEFCDLFS